MSGREVKSPRTDEGFISWGKDPVNAGRLGQFVAYYKSERNGLVSRALDKGDTDYIKGQVCMLDSILKQFSFLAETETETGLTPETETETADKEQ